MVCCFHEYKKYCKNAKEAFPSEIENSFLLALKQSENYENEGS